MFKLTGLLSEAEYRKYPAFSQSELGWLDVSPSYYKSQKEQKEDKDFQAFIIGGAVDTLLTDPLSFDSKYYVSDTESVSGELLKFIKAYAAEMLRSGDENLAVNIAYTMSGYKAPLKTVLNYLAEPKSQKNLRVYMQANGRKVINSLDMATINGVVRAINLSPFGKYFKPSNDELVDHYYQVPIFMSIPTDLGEAPCKGLIDLLVIDHREHKIKVFDLKTSGKSVVNFKESFLEFRYYLQASMYHYGLRLQPWVQQLIAEGYVLEDFKFIVAEKACKLPPVEWCTNTDILVKGMKGFTDSKGNYRRGLIQLAEDLLWHQNNNEWNIPRALIENKFSLTLSV